MLGHQSPLRHKRCRLRSCPSRPGRCTASRRQLARTRSCRNRGGTTPARHHRSADALRNPRGTRSMCRAGRSDKLRSLCLACRSCSTDRLHSKHRRWFRPQTRGTHSRHRPPHTLVRCRLFHRLGTRPQPKPKAEQPYFRAARDGELPTSDNASLTAMSSGVGFSSTQVVLQAPTVTRGGKHEPGTKA